MESISESDMGIYLYVTFPSQKKDLESHQAVVMAKLYSEAAIHMEKAGDYSFVFTTILPYEELKSKLWKKNVPFLLINIGLLYDLESICGFLPDTEIETLKNIMSNKFSKEKPHLQKLLTESLDKEKYELAAKLRDVNK